MSSFLGFAIFILSLPSAMAFGNINKLQQDSSASRDIGESEVQYQFRVVENNPALLKVNRNDSTQIKAEDIQVYVEKSKVPGYEHQEGTTVPLTETPYYKKSK